MQLVLASMTSRVDSRLHPTIMKCFKLLHNFRFCDCADSLCIAQEHNTTVAMSRVPASHPACSTLHFSAYAPRWLPDAASVASSSPSLLEHIVGGEEPTTLADSGAHMKQLQKLAALGYDTLTTQSGVSWWANVSPSAPAQPRGPPPAADYNRLLGLERPLQH